MIAIDGELRAVPTIELFESPLNPRRIFGDLDEMARGLKAARVIPPLVVRPREAGGFEIAAGHRRFRAAQLGGLSELPCVVQPMDDQTFAEVLAIENIGRRDLHALEEAAGFRMLRTNCGYTVEAIAEKLGKDGGSAKSAAHVYARLKLLDLIEPAQEMFLADGMTDGHAVLIARRRPADQERALQFMRGPIHDPQRKITVRELAKWIRENLDLDLAEATFPQDDVSLLLEAGACTNCPKRSGCDPTQAEVSEPNLCQDGACYNRKVDAHVERQRADLKRKGEYVEITMALASAQEGVLGRLEYHLAEDSDLQTGENVISGLVVEGRERGAVISIVLPKPATAPPPSPSPAPQASKATPATNKPAVATAPASAPSRQAAPPPRPAPPSQTEQDSIARRAAYRLEVDARAAILKAILSEVKWPLGRKTVEFALWNLQGEDLADRHPQVFGGDANAVLAALAKVSETELARYMVEAIVGDELDVSEWAVEERPIWLERCAVLYGVDAKKIRADVERKQEAAVEPKKKAPAVKVEKKKPAAPAPKKPAPKQTVKSGPAKKAPAKKAAPKAKK